VSSGAPVARASLRSDRLLEVLAVVLLGVATVGSAWCGYQATRWSKEEGDWSRDAASANVESARLFGRATQTVSYDSSMIALYAQAQRAGDDALVDFYRDTLVRPEFRAVIDRWKAQLEAGETPTNLLEDEAYLSAQLRPSEDAQAAAAAAGVEADDASEHADGYVLTTLILATALFFAGVTGSFRMRWIRVGLLAASAVAVAVAAARLADLPTA
jgi:hypothetical protein